MQADAILSLFIGLFTGGIIGALIAVHLFAILLKDAIQRRHIKFNGKSYSIEDL